MWGALNRIKTKFLTIMQSIITGAKFGLGWFASYKACAYVTNIFETKEEEPGYCWTRLNFGVNGKYGGLEMIRTEDVNDGIKLTTSKRNTWQSKHGVQPYFEDAPDIVNKNE